MKEKIGFGFLISVFWWVLMPAAAQDVPFGPPEVIDPTFPMDYLFAADLDRDGDPDPIAVTTDLGQVAWWPAPAPGGAWSRRLVDASFAGASEIRAADLDRDGDLDLLGASATAGVVAWWENVDLALDLWTRHVVDAAFGGAIDVLALDVDGDGDLDLAAAGRDMDAIAWWENRIDESLDWVRRLVVTDFAGANSLGFGDVDRDGDLDLGGTAQSSGQVAWFENAIDEDGEADWIGHVVDTVASPVDANLFDYDRDGEIEIVVLDAPEEGSQRGPAGGTLLICSQDLCDEIPVNVPLSLDQVCDSNRNGLLEVAGEAAYEYFDGSPVDVELKNLPPYVPVVRTRKWAVTRDGKSDSRLSEVTAAWGELSSWVASGGSTQGVYIPSCHQDKFLRRPGSMVEVQLCGGGPPVVAISSAPADPTSKGVNPGGGVGWLGAADGWSGEWQLHPVDPTFPARDALIADLDGNGTWDIVAASEELDRIGWWSNDDGEGGTWTTRTIANGVDGAIRVATGDIDGDGDLDVAAAAFLGAEMVWFENAAGDGSVWVRHTVDASVSGAHEAILADVDGDGDLDLLGAAYLAGTLHWWENVAGDGSAWVVRLIATGYPGAARVRFADLDGDGDRDVVAVALTAGDVVWFENVDGAGGAWEDHLIDGVVPGAIALDVADSDLDGDLDIAVAAFDADQVVYYDNALGDGSFFFKFVVDDALDGATAVAMADVDLDGDLDLVVAGTFAQEVRIWTNIGGQYAFSSTDTAPAELPSRTLDDLLAVALSHKGRFGDDDVEWARVVLKLEAPDGTVLPADQARLAFKRVALAQDDGSGLYEPGSDAIIYETSGVAVTDGVLALDLPDDDPRLRVDVGPPSRYFIVAELSGSAAARLPDGFRITHRIVNGSVVEDAVFDTVLRPQEDPDTTSGVVLPTGCPLDDLDLRVRGAGTTFLDWSGAGGATAFDVIRGDLAGLGAGGESVTLGAVVCLENDSADTTTDAGDEAAHPDTAVPDSGQAFFYLVRPSGTNFGRGVDCGLQRQPTAGDCPAGP